MLTAESPKLLLNRSFSDTDEYASHVGWEFDFRQLDPGPLEASAVVLGHSRTIIMRAELNRAIHQVGQSPSSMVSFGIPDSGLREFKWCGKDVSSESVLNFNLDSGFEGVSPAGFGGFSIGFCRSVLEDVSEMLELGCKYGNKIKATGSWSNAHYLTRRLRRRLFSACYTVPRFRDAEANELFSFSAAAMLLEFLTYQTVGEKRVPLDFRRRALKMSMEWIEETDELPRSVAELCQKTGFSAPTLYRAFTAEFDVGPKRYLHVKRLSGARRDLRSMHDGESISDIANRWGFWHIGQFAADYKVQFGELPSDTCNRR